MEQTQSFAYSRTFFYLRALLLLALYFVVVLFLALQTVTPAPWIAMIAAILVVHLLVVGLSPLLTQHVLTRSRIILRQGLYFRTIIPFEEAESIGPWDGTPKFGLRLSRARSILFVVGSAQNLVSVRLRTSRRFPFLLYLRAQTIVFDVGDRDAFLAAVEERRRALEPLPAYEAPILPAGPR